MGDAADDILDGECCEVCGQFLANPSGFPQTCVECGGDAELLGLTDDDEIGDNDDDDEIEDE